MLEKFDAWERTAIGMVSRLLPWLAPIPSAYLIGKAAMNQLQFPLGLGLIVAVIVEFLGLAAMSTFLDVFIFNQNRRKSDPPAPLWLPIMLVALYLILVISLTVIIEIVPSLTVYSPVLYPGISLAGYIMLSLQYYLSHRRKMISDEKAERRAERQAARSEQVKIIDTNSSSSLSNTMSNNGDLDRLEAGKQEKKARKLTNLLGEIQKNPGANISDLARILKVSRQTVYSHLELLEKEGRIQRDKNGLKVIS